MSNGFCSIEILSCAYKDKTKFDISPTVMLFIPEYQETVKLNMTRKSRALVRVVERKTIKFEVWYKR